MYTRFGYSSATNSKQGPVGPAGPNNIANLYADSIRENTASSLTISPSINKDLNLTTTGTGHTYITDTTEVNTSTQLASLAVRGGLYVAKKVYANNAEIASTASIGGTLTGAAANFSGSVSETSLVLSGATTIGGILTVNNTANVSGGLNVTSGNTVVGSLQASGITSSGGISAATIICNSVTALSALTLSGNSGGTYVVGGMFHINSVNSYPTPTYVTSTNQIVYSAPGTVSGQCDSLKLRFDQSQTTPRDINIGWNSTTGVAEIQALQNNVTWTDLSLCPGGGSIRIPSIKYPSLTARTKTEGTVSLSATGPWASAQTVTCNWVKEGRQVGLQLTAATAVSTSAVAITISGLPSNLYPMGSVYCPAVVFSSGAQQATSGLVLVNQSGGTILVFRDWEQVILEEQGTADSSLYL